MKKSICVDLKQEYQDLMQSVDRFKVELEGKKINGSLEALQQLKQELEQKHDYLVQTIDPFEVYLRDRICH